ncbi:glycoprotein precursor [Bruges virus]|uniref:Envelopment polyprotein n=1 Tax=Bruges virus TaxID=1679445 RepID=A0A1B2TSN4_9VIRU|nr:glycoprotein precursor [Bruges virus]AOC84247.1 glycoprotein precursor [Bruges virus]
MWYGQRSVHLMLLLWATTVLGLRNVFELKVECPHSAGLLETTLSSSIILPSVPIGKLSELEVESSCSMEVHNMVKSKQQYTKLSWEKKSSHSGKATETSFEGKSQEVQISGTCIIGPRIVEQVSRIRKAVICYDLICNQTHCRPHLYFLSPIQACNMMRSCIIGIGQFRVQVLFQKTYCMNGILVEGRCFKPDKSLWSSVKPGILESATIDVVCFFIAKKEDENFKIIEKIEKIVSPKCNTSKHKVKGYYTCIAGGNSDVIKVPNDNDIRSPIIFNKMVASPHGEDHDRIQDDFSHMRIAGKTEFKVPSTETAANFEGIAFSGNPSYTSLYVFSKDEDPKYILGTGVIGNLNQSDCEKKGLPLVWAGMIEVPGVYEEIYTCKVFCVLSGPGASCEAYSEGGIFNISSPTCLVSKQNTFKTAEQQVTFVCQRVDMDIIVYCNGQMKIIKTQTLVIGQCIYTITSFFSLLPSVAHSIAIELCVPGFHGWATAALVVTFCFGWIIIPTVTWLILAILKFIATLVHTQNQDSKFRQILHKIKEEYEKTKGSMVCDVCKLECDTAKELKAHNTSCHLGQCPYCLVPCEISETAFQAHFKLCQVTHRFSDDLKKSVIGSPQSVGCYRTLKLFRYKSRCYILTVWILLMTIESVLWAVSAEPPVLEPVWTDTVHGTSLIPLRTDLEVDFSLLSSSGYAYKRQVQNPLNNLQVVDFHVDIQPQTIAAEVQSLGHWFDARLNVKTSFHCYGSCSKNIYPWHMATCKHEHDFEYETNWLCNPPDCPGIGTGCTACGIYLDNLRSVGSAYRIVNIQYYRHVCVQIGEDHFCKDIGPNDCLVAKDIKICLVGTVSKFQPGDTLLFLGPLEGGGLVLRHWCTSCQFGDPGDIMKQPGAAFSCPEYNGSFRKKCVFATTPVCEYTGNIISGYKKLMATIDSFQSFNVSVIHYTTNRLEWKDPDGLLRDHINILLNKDLNFEDLSDNPCKVAVKALGVEGSWGSGVGFVIRCQVSLTECSKFLTAIKACDNALCYGASSVTLVRGNNLISITGRGGHSGSKFKCCHLEDCSAESFLANAPHVDRVMGIDSFSENKVYDDGASQCGFKCWFTKTGEWLLGLFKGNWMVIAVLMSLSLISFILLSFLCPIRKRKKN